MNDLAHQQLAAIRERYRESDHKTYAYTVIHADHEQARKDVRLLLAELAAAHERAATAERERIVGWLREQSDRGQKYLDDNGLDHNMHPSTVSAISTMRTLAGSIELGLYKGGGDG
mgnify:CR=1 FL=1